jgi:hypothetical protein
MGTDSSLPLDGQTLKQQVDGARNPDGIAPRAVSRYSKRVQTRTIKLQSSLQLVGQSIEACEELRWRAAMELKEVLMKLLSLAEE